MAFYVQALYSIEILRMQCEFLRDENKTIWFHFADQLVYRIIEKEGDQYAVK